MDNIIKSIEQALGSRNYFGALFIAVCVPDICGKIEFPQSRRPYKEWFEKYMPDVYKKHVTGSDAYAIRCAVLHEASSSLAHQGARDVLDKFFFTYTDNHLNTFNNTNGDNQRKCVLAYASYCTDLILAFRYWQEETLVSDEAVRVRFEKSESTRIQIDVGDSIPGVQFN